MRIDPRPYTLDGNERAVLRAALCAHVDALTRSLDRKRAAADRRSGDAALKVRAEIDTLENKRARAEDLIATFMETAK